MLSDPSVGRAGWRSFKTVVALCLPSYFTLLAQLGAFDVLVRRVGALDGHAFLYPIRWLLLLLYFGGTLGMYLLAPIAAMVIYKRLSRSAANSRLAGIAAILLAGAVAAAWYVASHARWG